MRVEVLECRKIAKFRKKVKNPGLNFDVQEEVETTDAYTGAHFTLHQCLAQVEKLRSVGTRRAEWEITNVRELCRLVPTGCYVESSIFRIAGLDAVRFVFYPNGIDDIPCQCAVFLKSAVGPAAGGGGEVAGGGEAVNHPATSSNPASSNRVDVRATISVNAVQRTFVGDLRGALGKRKFCSLNGTNRCLISVDIESTNDHAVRVTTLGKYGVGNLENVFRVPSEEGSSPQATSVAAFGSSGWGGNTNGTSGGGNTNSSSGRPAVGGKLLAGGRAAKTHAGGFFAK